MPTSSATGGKLLAELIKEFLEKVTPTPGSTVGPKLDDNIWEGLITFEKGIFNLDKEEVKAGWAALQVVKEMLSKDLAGNETKLRFITRLEWRILERMWFLSDGMEINFGTGLREGFARWTGKHEFFAGTVMPDITFYMNTNGGGNGGGNGNGSSTPVSQRPVANGPAFSQVQIDAFSRLFDEKFDSKFTGLSTSLKTYLQGATLTGLQQFVLYSGWVMVAIMTGWMIFYQPSTKEVIESVVYAKERVLEVKTSVGDNGKSLNQLQPAVQSLQDSVNKLMPKPKARK